MNYLKTLKQLEEEMKGIDLKLAGYLHCRNKFRITDMEDIKKLDLRKFKNSLKTKEDMQMFLHYHYYLGKWAAYQFVLSWLIENWHKKENKELANRDKFLGIF